MYDYFGFLEARNLDYRDCLYDNNHSIVATYRDWSIRQGLSPTTVNYRLRLILQFYRYAFQVGWVSRVPYDIDEVIVPRRKDFYAHFRKSAPTRGTPSVLMRETRPLLRLLSMDQIRSLMEGTMHHPTLNLILRLEIQTGLRKEEALSFPASSVINPAHDRRTLIPVELNPREMSVKGDRARRIDVPWSLMDRLWQYKLHERQARLDQSGTMECKPLFITRFGHPYSVNSQSINAQIKRHLGFVYQHMLRHSYATYTLISMKQHMDVGNALMYLRDRLGHASVTTTEIYLHYVDMIEDRVLAAFQEEIDRL
ncbi:MAG: tyrosine-type recombinase/integrase [Chromatiales bacterium]|nr:tyrosine-type recombinase/integrase [Chromatiales bacterium]